MITRYVVYFIAFLSSMMIAARMGPYYLGIWGFITLLIRYFHILDLSIGNSITILLVQNKNNQKDRDDYEKAAIAILSAMSFVVLMIGLYYYIYGIPFFEKYKLGNMFYFVCFIAVLQYFNDYFLKIYRVKGKMFEFTFYQTITQILVLAVVFFARGEKLVHLLIGVYVISHLLSLFFFILGNEISVKGKFRLRNVYDVLKKGIFLFIYNFCFYMIIISTKTIIGAYYTVEEFGYFTFAYTLAHAAILLLTAFSFLITPKLLDKFNSPDGQVIDSTIRTLRVNYVYLSHGLMYAAMILFPVLLYFLPKYTDTLKMINLTSLATILYANSFGYSSFLMARNKEQVIAMNSFVCLLVNVIMALFMVKVLHVSSIYVILATLLSYFLYAWLSVYCGKKELLSEIGFRVVLKEVFPVGILFPFIGAVVVTIINCSYLMFIPLFVFLLINRKEIREIFISFKRILNNPKVVDIN
jgi:O-antigen/teichoic acid export membrane protein